MMRPNDLTHLWAFFVTAFPVKPAHPQNLGMVVKIKSLPVLTHITNIVNIIGRHAYKTEITDYH